MKKIILLIALVIAPSISFGQSVFDKLENLDEVSSFIINKDAFLLLQKFGGDMGGDKAAVEAFKSITDLKDLKVFRTSNSNVAKTMEEMVSTTINKSKLTELMRMKDKSERVKIYVKTGENKDFVSEVLMFVSEIDGMSKKIKGSTIISLTGIIDVNKLSSIASQFSKDEEK